MIIYNILKIKGLKNEIEFGIPDNNEELTKMFKLRFEIYSKNNYIDPSKYPNQLEIDDYDKNNKCIYFIAKINDEIIGSTRAIIDDPLPTQLYFDFQEPDIISKIPSGKRAEVSRLIVKPYKINNKHLPRHLVTLFIIKSLIDYGLKNNFLGGYSFITQSLYKKFKLLSFPIYKINNYTQKYPDDGVLYRYFNNQQNPIIPVYYVIAEINKYLDIFFKKWFFSKKENNIIILNKPLLYKIFLKIKTLKRLLQSHSRCKN